MGIINIDLFLSKGISTQTTYCTCKFLDLHCDVFSPIDKYMTSGCKAMSIKYC